MPLLWHIQTRKPCCRKETARCHSCFFLFKVRRRHSYRKLIVRTVLVVGVLLLRVRRPGIRPTSRIFLLYSAGWPTFSADFRLAVFFSGGFSASQIFSANSAKIRLSPFSDSQRLLFSIFTVVLQSFTLTICNQVVSTEVPVSYCSCRRIFSDLFVSPTPIYTGWPKLKYPSSKFAISWQSFGILPWNLQRR